MADQKPNTFFVVRSYRDASHKGVDLSTYLTEMTPENMREVPDSVFAPHRELLYRQAGAGGFDNQLQTFYTNIDRFQRNHVTPNVEHSGFIFITRPKLNLTSASLRADRVLAPMDSFNPRSVAFALRCILDTKFCRDYSEFSSESPLLNIQNPFNIVLGNSTVGFTGIPDMEIQTFTTEGGFFCEDQTFPIGFDDFNRTYNLSVSLKDVIGGPCATMMDMWCRYMHLVTRGHVLAYKEDIDAQRMNFTVSFYRFNIDPVKRYITKYAKCTGCFPKSSPIGGMLNMNEGEINVSGASKFTIGFVCNKIEVNDPAILLDFNILAKRYCPDIEQYPELDCNAHNNFMGVPYIVAGRYGPEVVWKDVANREYTDDEYYRTADTKEDPSERIYINRDEYSLNDLISAKSDDAKRAALSENDYAKQAAKQQALRDKMALEDNQRKADQKAIQHASDDAFATQEQDLLAEYGQY